MNILPVIGIWVLLGAAATIGLRSWFQRQQALARLDEAAPKPAASDELSFDGDVVGVSRWLFLAGVRSPDAAARYLVIQFAAVLLAVTAGLVYALLGLQQGVLRGVRGIPGGLSDMVLPVALITPWLTALAIVAFPVAIVSRWRRQRVERIEQDLPLVLDLLATLGESGIGFDAALDRILDTRLGTRPLAAEFRILQADLLGGRTRVNAFRRLSRRVQVTTVSAFISALVQADQLGMGLAAVLRRQADDLRDRRRQQAHAFAAALPVRRLFAMIPCFLPGLFVWPLGPVFIQLIEIADTFLRARVGP